MAKIFVTGSSGFIGTQLIKKLKNFEVITDSINSKKIDLKKMDELIQIESSDIVIHLAAKTQKGGSWNEYFDNNVTGTKNILEYCIQKKVKKIIFLSSYVYGNPKYLPIDENHPISPHNDYTKSKFIAEELCEKYAKEFNLNVIILRPFNIFGETLDHGFLISNLINSLNNNKIITITNEFSKRDFLFIQDLIDLILKIIEYDFKFEIFNVGSGKSYSFKQIVEKIEKISNKKLKLEFKYDEENCIKDIIADISKVSDKIGWKPNISFDEGIQRCYDSK
jgi:nucleoside-diphosphate-sugar epimerase